MYKAFYGLNTHPFEKGTASSGCFESSAFKESRARLDYLKNTRGFAMLTGDPGSGKTTALRAFADGLNPALYKVMYFPMASGTVMDFYRALALCLGEQPKFRKVDLFFQIQQAILELYDKRRITPVFILDEMQSAKGQFLTDLSLLFNFNMDTDNPFILVMAGLPFLADRLRLNQNRSLDQRIVMRYHVEPLDQEEVEAFIKQKMQTAGANRPIFMDSAITAIGSASRGYPRVIENLATHALLLGCQCQQQTIDDEIVLKAALEAGIQ